MAQLILTEEEKAAPTYLDWDDASVGMAVRKLALLYGDEYGKESMFAQMAAQILVSFAHQVNATTTEVTLEGCTTKGVQTGDWKVTIERTNPPHD